MSLQDSETPLTHAVIFRRASVAKYLVNVSNADCSKVPQVTFVQIVLETIMPCKFITLMDLQKLNIIARFLIDCSYAKLWKFSYRPAEQRNTRLIYPIGKRKINSRCLVETVVTY